MMRAMLTLWRNGARSRGSCIQARRELATGPDSETMVVVERGDSADAVPLLAPTRPATKWSGDMDLEQTEQRTAAGSGISCRSTPEGTVVTLWGEVDAALREAASEVMAVVAVHTPGVPIVIEARDVTFIDSSGIAFILQVFVLAQETGTPMRLREPSEPVVEVLDMVGIGDRIPVERVEDEAF